MNSGKQVSVFVPLYLQVKHCTKYDYRQILAFTFEKNSPVYTMTRKRTRICSNSATNEGHWYLTFPIEIGTHVVQKKPMALNRMMSTLTDPSKDIKFGSTGC